MNWQKCLSAICAAVLMVTACSGCGSEKTQEKNNSFDKDIQSTSVTDTFIAENGDYVMSLNETSMGITLKNTKTGKIYGTNPADTGEVQLDELGMPIKRHPQVESVLFIEYLDVEENVTSKLISYTAAVTGGRTVYEKCENGVKINYYFDDAEIMVPVTYTLRDDGVAVSIDPKEIEENENMLISVSVSPFFCSVKNTDEESYLMYPSGSGALVYAKEISQPGESYSDEVYGTDAAKEVWDEVTTEKSIRLPVFAAKSGNQAVLGIIEEGAESSLVDMTVGSTSIGYSAVYVTYQLRGYTANIKELYNNRYYKGNVYADNMVESPLTIGFYPLADENADYSAMAAVYRDYLDKAYGEVRAEEISTLDITAVGGAMIRKSFLGIPYETLYATTTLEETEAIISDLEGSGVQVSNLNLYGFTENGIDSDKLAGNFKIDSKLGKVKQLKGLKEYCEKLGTELFLDFNTVTFTDSANGYSSYFDAAVRANRKTAKAYSFDIAVLGRDTENSASVLARDRIKDIADDVTGKASKWGIDIGLSSLSSIAYSDYSDKNDASYYAKAGMAEQVIEALNSAKEKDIRVTVSDANAYAAAYADTALNIPTFSTGASVFDEDIPFYSMALRGRTSISSESLNLASDSKAQLLRAIENGAGISYTVTNNYSVELIDSTEPLFYNSLYSDLKNSIIENYNLVSEFYDAIGNSEITEHIIHKSGLRETVFSNGVRVFVNYSDQALASDAGEVSAKSFVVLEAKA